MVKFSEPRKGSEEFIPKIIPGNPDSNGLVVFRKSHRWCADPQSPKTLRSVPYIDRSGLIYATTIGWWKCSSYQLYATIVATVYKRLSSLLRSIPDRKRRLKDSNLLLKIALHYSATNDDSWYKRCLSMLFNKDKNLLHFVYRKIKNVDVNKGFLYDQALKNASWFKRHSRFTRKCDKSTIDAWKERYPRHYPFDGSGWGPVPSCSRALTIWAGVYTRPNGKRFLSTINSPYTGKSSSLFRGNLDSRISTR